MGGPLGPAFRTPHHELHATDSTPAGMVWVPGTGAGANQTSPGSAPEKTSGSGWIGTKCPTGRSRVCRQGRIRKAGILEEPFVKEGKALPWQQAMAEFRDPTGRRDLPAGNWALTRKARRFARWRGELVRGGGICRVRWQEPSHCVSMVSSRRYWPTVRYSELQQFCRSGTGPDRELSEGSAASETMTWRETYRSGSPTQPDERRYMLGGAWDTPGISSGWDFPMRGNRSSGDPRLDSAAPNTHHPSRTHSGPVHSGGYETDVVTSPSTIRRTSLPQPARLRQDRTEADRGAVKTSLRIGEGERHVSRPRMDAERVIAHLYLPRNSTPPYQIVAFIGGSDTFNRPRKA